VAQKPATRDLTLVGGNTPGSGAEDGFVLTAISDELCDWKPLPPAAGGIGEAPEDAKLYGRKDAAWEEVVIPAAPPGGIDEAPEDGALYGRRDAGWEEIVIPAIPPSGIEEAPEDGLVYARKDAAWEQLEDAVEEAPNDGELYGRRDESWVAIPAAPPGGIGEAPENGELYGRKDGAWEEIIIPPTVDLSEYLLLAGGQMTGALLLDGMPTTAPEAANKGYVDTQIGNLPPPNNFTKLEADTLYLSLGGGSITGHLELLAGNPVDPRQAVTKSYVDAEIGRVPPIPPDLLTKTEASTTYIPLVGNLFTPMTGPLVLIDGAPAQPNYATPRSYVDTQISDLIHRSGDTMSGRLYLAEGEVDEDYQATHKLYVDDAIAAAIGGGGGGGDFLPLAGGTMLGFITLSGEPADDLHAATKLYVDQRLGSSAGPFLPLTGGKLEGPGNLEVIGEILARGQLSALGSGGLRIIPPGEGIISFTTTSSVGNGYRIVVNNTQGNNRMRIESMTSGVPQYRTLLELDGSVGGTGKVRLPQGGTSPLPTGPDDIANKSYIDELIASGDFLTKDIADTFYLQLSGGELTGSLLLDHDPVEDNEAATKFYVDQAIESGGGGGGGGGGGEVPGPWTRVTQTSTNFQQSNVYVRLFSDCIQMRGEVTHVGSFNLNNQPVAALTLPVGFRPAAQERVAAIGCRFGGTGQVYTLAQARFAANTGLISVQPLSSLNDQQKQFYFDNVMIPLATVAVSADEAATVN
jgi:hypothetical protein